MKFTVDYLIDLMQNHSDTDNQEFKEQETAGGGGGGKKPPYPTVTKWETGLVRGPANQIGLTKWSEIVKLNRGKANTLL
jgi:hypothetical protein